MRYKTEAQVEIPVFGQHRLFKDEEQFDEHIYRSQIAELIKTIPLDTLKGLFNCSKENTGGFRPLKTYTTSISLVGPNPIPKP